MDFILHFNILRRAFLDLQTNSNNLKIASAIAFSVVVFDDEEELYYHESLIKPLQVLSPDQEFTYGITNKSLRKAPSFIDIASLLIDNLEDCEIAYFDNFSQQLLRSSFREIGYPLGKSSLIFNATSSRKSSSAAQLSFEETAAVHLVEYDSLKAGMNARALSQLFQIKASVDDNESYAFAKAEQNTIATISLYDHLPKTSGVYYFRNAADEVIYVGKAVDLKKRVISHFKSRLVFEKTLCKETVAVEYVETGNELIALLKESAEIKQLAPTYNSQQIETNNPWIVESKIDAKGILRIVPTEKSYTDSCHTVSFNRDSVIQQLKLLQIMHALCPRFMGVERTAGSCSSKACKGVCRGEEPKEIYNARVYKALETLASKEETYYLDLIGRTSNERSFVLVVDGIYMGYGYITNQETVNTIEDLEAYLIPQEHTYYTSRSILTHLKKRGVIKNFLR